MSGATLEINIDGNATKMTIDGGNLTDPNGHKWVLKEQPGSQASGAAALQNDDVIKMVKAGLDDAIVIAKIGSSRCQFDTSTDALIRLKQSGVGAAVLKALIAAGVNGPVSAVNQPPTAEAILDRYVAVTGGKEAYLARHSEFASGTIEYVGTPLKGTVTYYQAEPNLSYRETEISNIGKTRQGTDGKIAWVISPKDIAKLQTGDALARAIRGGAFNGEIRWRELFKRVELVGTESIDGKDAYAIVLTPNEGKPITRYYDIASGLAVKMTLLEELETGSRRIEMRLNDYRNEGGIVRAHEVRQIESGHHPIVVRYDTFKFNEQLPAGVFDVPREVTALLGTK
jgi:hypothetical protein